MNESATDSRIDSQNSASHRDQGVWRVRSVGWAFLVVCIVVWTVASSWSLESSESSRGRESNEGFVVDLNLANEAELNLLPGVGPKLAREILRIREERGRFESVDELKRVPGIKGTRFETLKKHVCVGP